MRFAFTAAKQKMEELQALKLSGQPYNAEQLWLLEERKHLMDLYATQDE